MAKSSRLPKRRMPPSSGSSRHSSSARRCSRTSSIAGSPEYPAEVVDHVQRIAGTVPTVVDVFADRPAILEPFVECAVAVTLNSGANAAALLDVLTGAAEPQGRLPFDLPRSMAAVAASRPDVPFDTVDPLFRFGHGVKL